MIEVNKIDQPCILPNKLEIKEQAILDLLGYHTNNPDHHVLDVIRIYIEKCSKLYAPKGAFVIKPLTDLQVASGTVTIEDTIIHTDKIIAGQLKNSQFIVLFICTIGKEIETLYEELFGKGDMLEGFIVNLIGSEAAESTAEFMHVALKKHAELSGLQITNRFSPGYCNWNVEEQFKLFSFFPGNFCGISLTDSALMIPIKSVSGIIGIGENVKYRAYPCAKCQNPNCLYKKKIIV